MSFDLNLAPVPKRFRLREGVFNPEGKLYIKLEAGDPTLLLPAARKTGLGWKVTASPKASKQDVGLTLRISADSGIASEGYNLSVNDEGIEIIASDPAGAYYGACTLAQILRQCGGCGICGFDGCQNSVPEIPCLSISDWPDFSVRGVMLDISRDKVPTMETLFYLVDLMAEWKINQLQLYTEHTFAYLAHPVVWKNADPMTGEEIMALDAYCKARFIELVPNQNSFGHMERWLMHKEYNSLAEAPNGCDTIWGWKPAFSLCPGDKRSVPFVRGLFDELLPHFTSGMFNVGCDETVDLGCGRSKRACEERGKGRVYLDFLLQIHRMVEERGKVMQFWGDIILQHPELIPDLPKEVITLEWGYEFDHPFAKHSETFRDSGIPFYLCPGTATWNTLAGKTDNAIGNIANAAKNGLKNDAIGLLNTDWGDNGHWQPLSVSYLGFLAGAMASWNSKTELRKVLPASLSLHAFGDATGKTGQAFFDLGNVYKVFHKRTHNSTIPWQVLFRPADNLPLDELSVEEFEAMEEKLPEISSIFAEGKMTSRDAGIVRQEFDQAVKMLNLSAEIGKALVEGGKPKTLSQSISAVKKRQERVWLLRNRPGGLSDSLGRLRPGM